MESNSDYVILNVSNSKNDHAAFEIKFEKSLSIPELKKKLEVITGGNAGTMQIQLYKGQHVVAVLNDEALLGSFHIDNGMRLHVIDNFAWTADENIEKFELSQDQYEQKNDTVRNFLKQNRLGKYNEEEMRHKEEKRLQQLEEEARRAELCVIGSRCKVNVAGNPTRLGTIMYKGALDGIKGTFIGVQYDEPLGKNNGTVNGKSYFVCPPKYGGFVNPTSVEVGDFPREDTELDEEI